MQYSLLFFMLCSIVFCPELCGMELDNQVKQIIRENVPPLRQVFALSSTQSEQKTKSNLANSQTAIAASFEEKIEYNRINSNAGIASPALPTSTEITHQETTLTKPTSFCIAYYDKPPTSIQGTPTPMHALETAEACGCGLIASLGIIKAKKIDFTPSEYRFATLYWYEHALNNPICPEPMKPYLIHNIKILYGIGRNYGINEQILKQFYIFFPQYPGWHVV